MALYLGPGDLERLFTQRLVDVSYCIDAVESSWNGQHPMYPCPLACSSTPDDAITSSMG